VLWRALRSRTAFRKFGNVFDRSKDASRCPFQAMRRHLALSGLAALSTRFTGGSKHGLHHSAERASQDSISSAAYMTEEQARPLQNKAPFKSPWSCEPPASIFPALFLKVFDQTDDAAANGPVKSIWQLGARSCSEDRARLKSLAVLGAESVGRTSCRKIASKSSTDIRKRFREAHLDRSHH
jgi:hypothetical protein